MSPLPCRRPVVHGDIGAHESAGSFGKGKPQRAVMHVVSMPRHRSRRGVVGGRQVLEGGREVTVLERRIRWAAVLVAIGIGIQLASLYWDHPLSFMAFLGLGCPVVLLGVLLYLYSLSTARASDEP